MVKKKLIVFLESALENYTDASKKFTQTNFCKILLRSVIYLFLLNNVVFLGKFSISKLFSLMYSIFILFLLYLYIYPPDSQESNGGIND